MIAATIISVTTTTIKRLVQLMRRPIHQSSAQLIATGMIVSSGNGTVRVCDRIPAGTASNLLWLWLSDEFDAD